MYEYKRSVSITLTSSDKVRAEPATLRAVLSKWHI